MSLGEYNLSFTSVNDVAGEAFSKSKSSSDVIANNYEEEKKKLHFETLGESSTATSDLMVRSTLDDVSQIGEESWPIISIKKDPTAEEKSMDSHLHAGEYREGSLDSGDIEHAASSAGLNSSGRRESTLTVTSRELENLESIMGVIDECMLKEIGSTWQILTDIEDKMTTMTERIKGTEVVPAVRDYKADVKSLVPSEKPDLETRRESQTTLDKTISGVSQMTEFSSWKDYEKEDLPLPDFIQWDHEKVAQWIGKLGYPHYEDCFRTNFVTGRKLILMCYSALPSMGIEHFDDIKAICKEIYSLIKIQRRSSRRWHIFMDAPTTFLEQKSKTGPTYDALIYKDFVEKYRHLFGK